MRTIKFRAIRTDSLTRFGKLMFVEGCLVKTPITAEFNDTHGAYFDSSPHPTKPEWPGRWCIVTEHGVAHEIDINTVGQFTGLHDKNGKEIYEGDILKIGFEPYTVEDEDEGGNVTGEHTEYDNVEISEVRFKDCAFTVQANFGDYNETSVGWADQGGEAELDVIGNIHESPDLLK